MPQAATAKRTPQNGKASRSKPAEAPMLWSHGSFHWNELLARDIEAAKRFYKSTIGWSFEAMPMPGGGTYWIAMLNGKGVAGIFPIAGPEYAGMPEGWMSYLAVDDVDKRVAKALKAGAKLMKPIFDVPDVGRIAVLREPGGAGVGWMTPACDEVARRNAS